MWPNPPFSADLVTYTGEILDEKLFYAVHLLTLTPITQGILYWNLLEFYTGVLDHQKNIPVEKLNKIEV